MHLDRICRYPVKGFTPQDLEQSVLEKGGGLPFDRCCGFTSGNLPDPPVAGGWVPARTFLQLTVYPALAKFKAAFNEPDKAIEIIAPDGMTASARLEEPDSFASLNDMIRSHFEAGPHAIPTLHAQAPGCGALGLYRYRHFADQSGVCQRTFTDSWR